MKMAATFAGRLAGIIGGIQIVLGVLFWTGHALSLVNLHMLIGMVFVLALWTLCVLGVRAHLPWGTMGFTFAWSLVVPALGMAQMGLLPGPWHWVIRVIHLAVGLVAMNLGWRLATTLGGGARPKPRIALAA